MGNTSTGSSSLQPSHWPLGGQDSSAKQIHISTDKSDGFYFTGEYLTGTVEIPVSYLQQYLNNKSNRNLAELLRQQSLHKVLTIELVGDAIYSAEVDVAADSDGHASHQVNVCRQACYVTINAEDAGQSVEVASTSETSPEQKAVRTSDTQASVSAPLPTTVKGNFQLRIPEDLPASLINNRPPSVLYTLELNLASSRYRYQIPIVLSSKGYVSHLSTDIQLSNQAGNQHDIQLRGSVAQRFYRPGEQISVQVNYLNPQQRSIRSIRVTLLQVYRVHNDQFCSQLDGKEWTFDTSVMSTQHEWLGEARLQVPNPPLQASFSNQSVGTTQRIECELDYRIILELSEKKGDDIHLALPSITVTYQK